jgi:hypothetical protein
MMMILKFKLFACVIMKEKGFTFIINHHNNMADLEWLVFKILKSEMIFHLGPVLNCKKEKDDD